MITVFRSLRTFMFDSYPTFLQNANCTADSVGPTITFDAVDGKQARRTNSSSPLGELFDHGCDALACALEALAFASTAMCGRNAFWFWVISAIPFYLATWEHYFTNTLILPALNGPTEGLMLIYLAHIFTSIVGSEWWAQDFGTSIPLLSWVPIINGIPTSGVVLLFMILFAVIPTLTFNVQNVYKVVQSRKGSMLNALAMLIPFCVLLGVVILWDLMSPTDLMGNYPHMVVMGSGLAFGFLVGRMILSHLCDEPKGLKTSMSVSLFYLPIAIANTLTARLNDGIPWIDEKWVLLGFCVYTGALYLHFATSVIHEITSALGIACFSSDPDPVQDYCLPSPHTNLCKNTSSITVDDFIYSGIKHPGKFTNKFSGVPVSASVFPALNTLGMSLVRADFEVGGINVPHYHPRATEVAYVLEGKVYSGFVDTSNKVYAKVIEKGEVMVFPRGVLHFQKNVGDSRATIIGSFDSQNPGSVKLPTALFGSGIDDELLEKAFGLKGKDIDKLKKRFRVLGEE
ncbi:choline/ethanolaminephosphotransferase 1-like protein [Tanacetum coccineum]